MSVSSGEVFIVDWGIAKVDNWSTSSSNIDQSKVFVPISQKCFWSYFISGTPLYMAPEQISQPYLTQDARCDLFSIGIVLFEIIVGYRAFLGIDFKDIFQIKM